MSQWSHVEVHTCVDISPSRNIVLSVSVAFNVNWLCLQSEEVRSGKDGDIRCPEFRFLFNLCTLSGILAAGWNGSAKSTFWSMAEKRCGTQVSPDGTSKQVCSRARWSARFESKRTQASIPYVYLATRLDTAWSILNTIAPSATALFLIQEFPARRYETQRFYSHISVRSLNINALHLEMMLQFGEQIIRSRKSSDHKDSL